MTAQARSRNLDTDNLVLLVDHLGEFHRGLLLGGIITNIDNPQALFGNMASDIQSWNKARPIDPEDAVVASREVGMLSEDLITHPMHDDQEVN